MIATRRLGLVVTLCAAPLLACGTGSTSDSSVDAVAGNVSADATASTPTYDEAAEEAIDADVLADAPTGQQVVTLYFGGGSSAFCASWSITVHGGATVASDKALSAGKQGLLAESASGDLTGTFKVYGGNPGVRLLVPTDTQLVLTGTQGYCENADQTTFDVTVIVNGGHPLEQLFSGVAAGSQTGFLDTRLSQEKPTTGD